MVKAIETTNEHGVHLHEFYEKNRIIGRAYDHPNKSLPFQVFYLPAHTRTLTDSIENAKIWLQKSLDMSSGKIKPPAPKLLKLTESYKAGMDHLSLITFKKIGETEHAIKLQVHSHPAFETPMRKYKKDELRNTKFSFSNLIPMKNVTP